MLVAEEKDTCNGAFELRDSGHGLGDASVDVWVHWAGMVRLFDDMVAIWTTGTAFLE